MKNRVTQNLVWLAIKTCDGDYLAGYSQSGLARLNFPGARAKKVSAPADLPPAVCAWHQVTTQALQAVLACKDTSELPPLDLSVGTDFQRAVWKAMCRIRSGHTRSYGEIATDIGNPKAVRAVGGACGANPIPVLVPCHRVLAANQKIGGFSSGLDWKRKLLAREGVMLI